VRKVGLKKEGHDMEKRNCTRYSEELRAKIIAEYAKKELGYRKIAQKFGFALRCRSRYHTP